MKTMKNIMKKTALILSVSVLSLTFNSCGKDFLETKPTNRVSATEAMTTFDGAMMAINGIHSLMHGTVTAAEHSGSIAAGNGIGSLWLTVDHLGDDFVMWILPQGRWFDGLYDWVDPTRQTSSMVLYPYSWLYQIIGNANGIINNIDNIEADPNDRDFVKGQAYAYRAFAHFWAVQLFGKRYVRGGNNEEMLPGGAVPNGAGIPIVTGIGPTQPRATVAAVYAQINSDLDEAIRLLEGNPTAINRRNKSHINGNIAHGLKARVALVQQNWAAAAHHAGVARQGMPMATAEELLQGFHTVSARDWMWGINTQLQSSGSNFGNFIAVNNEGGSNTNRNTPRLANRNFFEDTDDPFMQPMATNDIRRDWWISDPVNDPRLAALRAAGFTLGINRAVDPIQVNRYANQKFRINGTWEPFGNTVMLDLPMMRTSEMLLIEAEANARGALAGVAGTSEAAAREALTILMAVRVSGYTTSNTGRYLIEEIMRNRRIELWGEGHRWLDLKRLGAGTAGILDGEGTLRRTGTQPGGQGHDIRWAGEGTITTDGQPVLIQPSDNRWQIHIPIREIDPSQGIIVQNP
jgi:hypothetical protein